MTSKRLKPVTRYLFQPIRDINFAAKKIAEKLSIAARVEIM